MGAAKFHGTRFEPFNEADGDASTYLRMEPVTVTALHASTLAVYWSCPRKFLLAVRMGLRRLGRPFPEALAIGSLFHRLLESYHLGQEEHVGLRACYAMAYQWADAESDPGTARAAMDKNVALAQAMARAFVKRFPRRIGEDFEQLLVEETIRVRPPGTNVDLEGTLDNVWRERDTGLVWLEDYKTTSDEPGARVATCSFEPATPVYRLLAESRYPSKVAGIVYTVILKPEARLCGKDRDFTEEPHTFTRGKRKGETELKKEHYGEPKPENYCARIGRWYNGEGEHFGLKDEWALRPPMNQAWIAFSGPPLSRETQLVLHEAGKALRATPDLHRFYRRGGLSCLGRRQKDGSSSGCPFLELCRRDPRSWRGCVEDLYRQKET
jgi:hypothetical protein